MRNLFKLKVSLKNQLNGLEIKIDQCKTFKEIEELINEILKDEILPLYKEDAKINKKRNQSIHKEDKKYSNKLSLKKLGLL